MQVDWFLVALAVILVVFGGYGLLIMPRGKSDKRKRERPDPAE